MAELAALMDRIVEAPRALRDSRLTQRLAELRDAVAAEPGLGPLSDALRRPAVEQLLAGVFSGSPYLSLLIQRDLSRLQRVLLDPPEVRLASALACLATQMGSAATMSEAMAFLRTAKTEVALLTALADLGGAWPVMTVTSALTQTADAALRTGVSFLFRQAAVKGDWRAADDGPPDIGSGYFVLGMGKYGAGELNYSSDIDLIVFFDFEKCRLRSGLEAQTFYVRLTRDLVRLMQERTAEGYVFRTDLRLRPDAGATQVALSLDAALNYYEAVGQNWERAAMIKARVAAGDIAAGEELLAELAPFVWRRYLDFAAIADIHAMKRQIHAFRGFGSIAVAGHNIKLGRGGIREIEFFAQTQQLIAGGRQADLRVRPTLEALERLEARGWIKPAVARDLGSAYLVLRRLEHRIQMVADDQSHEIPDDGPGLENLARFAGYHTVSAFTDALIPVLETVQRHYAALFEDSPDLTTGGVNMVFAGEEDDPATVAALTALGYSQPSQVLATVRGWHHGRTPAVRSAAARERLTEVQPLLIKALAETADPDLALTSFDRFLAELPAGVQLFSLLRANPGLMRLIADIMGTAPRLALILSRRRRLLDAVLDPRIMSTLPSAEELDALIAAEVCRGGEMQEILDRARVIGSEQAFLIGVRVLSGSIKAAKAGEAYALLAERLIAALQSEVERDLVEAHGCVPGGAAAVVAMGKLGGREMTAASDLDLIVIYDFDPEATQSDGARPLAPSHYYARLTQRLITALSAPTAEGRLYDVDLRLRPSGQKGPVATSLASFLEYQAKEAWTWEHLALTRARVLTGPPDFVAKVEAAIRQTLLMPRDRSKTTEDVRDMRERIWAEKGTDNIWELKQTRGGLVDLEFITQYLQLVHAAENPEILNQNTIAAYQGLTEAGLLRSGDREVLIGATRLLHDLTQLLRLCYEGPFDPLAAPRGLRDMLARAADVPSLSVLEDTLRRTLAQVAQIYQEIVH